LVRILILKCKREFDEVLSGYKPDQMVKRWKNQHFEDHLCPRPQGTSLTIRSFPMIQTNYFFLTMLGWLGPSLHLKYQHSLGSWVKHDTSAQAPELSPVLSLFSLGDFYTWFFNTERSKPSRFADWLPKYT